MPAGLTCSHRPVPLQFRGVCTGRALALHLDCRFKCSVGRHWGVHLVRWTVKKGMALYSMLFLSTNRVAITVRVCYPVNAHCRGSAFTPRRESVGTETTGQGRPGSYIDIVRQEHDAADETSQGYRISLSHPWISEWQSNASKSRVTE